MGNLNYRVSKDDLVEFLSPAGEIVDAFLPTDRETGKPRGFGFVTFATSEQALACIEQFNGKEMGGRRLNINQADDRRRGGGGGGRPERSDRGDRGPGPGGGGGRGRASPIAEFKRGGRVVPREGGGPGGDDRPRRPPPRRDGPPPDPDAVPPEEVYDTGGDFRYDQDATTDDEWSKKKKKRKGSRRGLRAKKRSL